MIVESEIINESTMEDRALEIGVPDPIATASELEAVMFPPRIEIDSQCDPGPVPIPGAAIVEVASRKPLSRDTKDMFDPKRHSRAGRSWAADDKVLDPISVILTLLLSHEKGEVVPELVVIETLTRVTRTFELIK
jgi:hypothetical protein